MKNQFKTMEEVKAAIDKGERVHWMNSAYICTKDNLGQYHVKCINNDSCVGLKADTNPKSYIKFEG